MQTHSAAGRADVPGPPAIFAGRAHELARATAADVRLCVVYGVAGIGKTSFVLRASHEMAARLGARLAYIACRDGESVVTATTSALAQITKRPITSADPLRALLEAALSGPIVLCIDDVHRTSDTALLDAAVYLATCDLPIRVWLASREALPLAPTAVDHMVVRLGALTPEEARELWDRLVALYGSPAHPLTMEAALTHAAGSPLSLKQAFAGPNATARADPLGLAGLPALEARLLTRASTLRRPVPIGALADASGHDELRAAAERLCMRFLAEWATSEALVVHDLVREAVSQSPLAPTAADHARCLTYFRARPVSQAVELEILYHAVACGEDALALEILGREAVQITRLPPGSGIVERNCAEAIDRLAGRAVVLPTPVRVLRARIRARQGDPAGALDELRALAPVEPLASADLGTIAVALGRLDEGEAVLARALADSEVAPLVRIVALAGLAGAYRDRHAFARAHRLLAAHEDLFAMVGPAGAGIRAWLESMLAYEARRYRAAAKAIAKSRAALAASPIPISPPLLASVERAIAAARGQAVEPHADAVVPGELFDETPFFRQTARLMRVEELLFRGDARAASRLVAQVVADCERTGYVRLHRRAIDLQARAAHMLGQGAFTPTSEPARTAEGFDAAARSLVEIEASLDGPRLAKAARLAARMAAHVHACGWRYLACRARLVCAEIAFRTGDLASVGELLAAARADAEAMDYAALLRNASLIDAAIARTAGHSVTTAAGDELAVRLGLADPLVCELRSSRGRRLLPSRLLDEWDEAPYALVVDLVRKRIKAGRRRVDLSGRGALLKLASVLADRPGEIVPTAELTRTLWNLEYHPLRHHSRVTMAITRLRALLGHKVIVGAGEGYRLATPGDWVVIAPFGG